MNSKLLLKFIEVQIKLLYPIAPHFSDYVWRNLLGNKTFLWNEKYPEVPLPNPQILDEADYLDKVVYKFRSSIESYCHPKPKKGQKAVVNEQPKEAKIMVGTITPDWQIECSKVLKEIAKEENNEVVFPQQKELASQLCKNEIIKKNSKKAMSFAMMLVEKAKKSGMSALDLSLKFNEVAFLESEVNYLQSVLKVDKISIVSVDKLDEKLIISDKDKLNEIALKTKLRIYPLPQYFLKRTNYALLNIFKLVKIKKEDIDINRFILALNKTIYNHPVLLSRFYEEKDGEIYIEYRPDLPPEIKIIQIKDEDIQNIKDNLLHIYQPFNSSLVNFTIFLSENYFYFYYDIFHSNFDGNSVSIFENNLESAYLNKTLPKDYFFLNLYNYNQNLRSKKYNDTVNFYKDNFNLTRDYCPKFDEDVPENIKNNDSLQLIYKEYSSEELREQLKKNILEKNQDIIIYTWL